jgi:hypothetical protein
MSENPKVGGVSLAEGEEWLRTWSQKLSVGTVVLSGGEPLLNPEIEGWLRKTREYFPNSTIKLTTNGMHIDKVRLLPLLFELGNVIYEVSWHLQGPPAEAIEQTLIAQATELTPNWHVLQNMIPGIPVSMTHNTVTIQMVMFDTFVKPYHGRQQLMRPWRSKNYVMSHASCGAPRNPMLFKNRVFKCPPLANLRDTLEQYSLLDNSDWQEFLAYKGYGPEDDLTEFIRDFGKPNVICNMCGVDGRAIVNHYDPAMVSIPIVNAE